MSQPNVLPSVLQVAAGLTRAKNALRPDPTSEYYNQPPMVRHAQAIGNLSYAIEWFWKAINDIRSDGHEFTNWLVDEPFGMMARAMDSLNHDASECNMWAQLEPLAQAHRKLERLHRNWGYDEITNKMINGTVVGVGGGR